MQSSAYFTKGFVLVTGVDVTGKGFSDFLDKGVASLVAQMVKVKLLSRVLLFAIPWTVACHAPSPKGLSRQEYWLGCHFLLQGIFLTQGSNPGLLPCRQILYCLSHQ